MTYKRMFSKNWAKFHIYINSQIKHVYNIIFRKEDPMYFVYYFIGKCFELSLMARTFFYFAFTMQFMNASLTATFFLQTLDFYILIDYAPFCVTSAYFLVTAITFWQRRRKIDAFLMCNDAMVKNGSKIIYRKHLNSFYKIRRIFCFNLLAGVFVARLYWPLPNNLKTLESFIYYHRFVNETFSKYHYVFHMLFTLSLVPSAFHVCCLPYYLTYITLKGTLTLDFISHLILGLKCVPSNVAKKSNRNYQEHVKKTLIKCIILHVQFKRCLNIVIDELFMPFVLTVTFGIGIIFFCISLIFNEDVDGAQVLSFGICISFCGYFVASSGQIITDESVNLYKVLYHLPYYEWNGCNQQLLLMFLLNAKIPLILLRCVFTIDHALIISLCKPIGTLTSLFLNLK